MNFIFTECRFFFQLTRSRAGWPNLHLYGEYRKRQFRRRSSANVISIMPSQAHKRILGDYNGPYARRRGDWWVHPPRAPTDGWIRPEHTFGNLPRTITIIIPFQAISIATPVCFSQPENLFQSLWSERIRSVGRCSTLKVDTCVAVVKTPIRNKNSLKFWLKSFAAKR